APQVHAHRGPVAYAGARRLTVRRPTALRQRPPASPDLVIGPGAGGVPPSRDRSGGSDDGGDGGGARAVTSLGGRLHAATGRTHVLLLCAGDQYLQERPPAQPAPPGGP